MKKYHLALVTGANGWLGLNLLAGLVKGLPDRLDIAPVASRIRCLVLSGSDTSAMLRLSPSLQIVQGDLRDPDTRERLLAGSDGAVLFHTAGVIHPKRVHEFYDINVKAAQSLLQEASEAGVERAVVVSSNSPLGCNAYPEQLFVEESPYHPYMNYGRSKMQLERAALEIGAAGEMEIVIVRAPWFYGPYQPARQILFFQMIRDGKGPIVGSGENRRSMANLTNLSQGLLLAAGLSAAAGQTYWIADERPYSMNEIMDTIERLLETEFGQTCAHKRVRLPEIVSEVALAIDWMLQCAGRYHQKIHVLSEMNKTIACSVDKAVRELGYAPTVALEEGMRRSLSDWLGKPAPASRAP
jgi:nucleoside-diphosphate-sugar epimerase